MIPSISSPDTILKGGSHSLAPLIQWDESTLASTLNYYFGNSEKSYILKYCSISGYLVNSYKLTDLRTSMNPSIRNTKKLCENTS